MKFIENVKIFLLLSILATIVVGLFCLKDINAKLSSFYQHDNVKINLAHVKYIQARVDYVATLSQDKSEDLHHKYSTNFDKQEIIKIEDFLELSKKSSFYDIQINSYMMFDNEKINMFQSKRYVKLPNEYKVNAHMLSTLKTYGIDDYQYQSLLKLQDQVFKSKDEFVDTVIDSAKLRRSDWLVTNIAILGVGQKEGEFLKDIAPDTKQMLLSDEDIEDIITSLNSSYDNYAGIR